MRNFVRWTPRKKLVSWSGCHLQLTEFLSLQCQMAVCSWLDTDFSPMFPWILLRSTCIPLQAVCFHNEAMYSLYLVICITNIYLHTGRTENEHKNSNQNTASSSHRRVCYFAFIIEIVLKMEEKLPVHAAGRSLNFAICERISKLWHTFYNGGLWENILKHN